MKESLRIPLMPQSRRALVAYRLRQEFIHMQVKSETITSVKMNGCWMVHL